MDARFVRQTPARVLAALGLTVAMPAVGADAAHDAAHVSKAIGIRRGICVVLGLPAPDRARFVTELAQADGLRVYFQSPDADAVAGVRKAAEEAGVLGTRVFADRGAWASIHLAANLAGAVWVAPGAWNAVSEGELRRVLHPGGKAIVGTKAIVKPFPDGVDDWSHPYHGPDNNPQSTDRLARAPYLTQFVAEPKFCPMPQVSVASGGRVFKAFGHIAHKANQNAWLNTLLCINAYNGQILWRRDLPEGFMIHRNTMVATPDLLYLADHRSCKLIDARTGKVTGEITIAKGTADGPVWKWMALEGGVLYALVGAPEVTVGVRRSNRPGLGHWPWGMWKGHDYKDPKTSFGFGRTLVAIRPRTRKILWRHRQPEYIDSRGVCMSSGRIFFYCPGRRVGCLDTQTGTVLWQTSEPALLKAIGPNGRAQHYVTGYATTTYIKCNARYVFFAGPQRKRLVVVSAKDGTLRWHREPGNLQLVLRQDALYAAGPRNTGCKMDYETGRVLARLPHRRACTRATGSVDSVFYRTPGGTVRIDVATNTAHHVAPMRPPCQDGVLIAGGFLYWGPWMCGCQLSLYGHICLGSGARFRYRPGADASRLESGPGDPRAVTPLTVQPGDWPCDGGDNRRSARTGVAIPRDVRAPWTFQPTCAARPTAPVVAGGIVFVGDSAGVVRALDAARGTLRWKTHTGAAVFAAPAVAQGRVYVGSADGRVYAFEAATGRRLWRFRAAPTDRWIPVFGQLISTWPVAGGVVVDRGVVYAAAGIAHYDGTHVYALDALTGRLQWYNDTSGTLSAKVNSGVSLQGGLYLAGRTLCFRGGNVYRTAQYDLATGRCLNKVSHRVGSSYATAFYPYYPRYGQYVSLSHTYPDGRTLSYTAGYEGSQHSRLALLAPVSQSRPTSRLDRRGRPRARRKKPTRRSVWMHPLRRAFNSFILGPHTLLAAGRRTGLKDGGEAFLMAVHIKDGAEVWRRDVPAPVVKGGTAVDHARRIVVCLDDGRVLGFAPAP